jgi:hypothetical protein
VAAVNHPFTHKQTERDVNAEILCAEALKVIGSTKGVHVNVIHHHKLNLQFAYIAKFSYTAKQLMYLSDINIRGACL